MEGRVIFNSNGRKASPIVCKLKKITKVCDSSKSADTRAADKLIDDAIRDLEKLLVFSIHF